MRSFKDEYQRWLDSPALSEQEWHELDAIRGDDKEIRERFYRGGSNEGDFHTAYIGQIVSAYIIRED